MVEDTFDWHAQDKDGNVWYFGAVSRTYEDGLVTSTEGSWEAGVDGAAPGISMLVNPPAGDTYDQAYYVGGAGDQAEDLSFGDAVTVQFGSFDHVLTTREWTNLEPDIAENMSHVMGDGLILEVSVKGENERSELERPAIGKLRVLRLRVIEA